MIKNIAVIVYLCLLLLASCQKNEISSLVDANHPYYIEGYLESGQIGIVHISLTKDITGTVQGAFLTRDAAIDFYKELKATVLLLKNNQVVDTLNQLSCQGKDFLLSKAWNQIGYNNIDTATRFWYLQGKKHIIEQGANYTMIVRIPSHPDMVATCNIPQKVVIQKLDTLLSFQGGPLIPYLRSLKPENLAPSPTNDSLYYFVPFYTFQLTFTDPSSLQNYYQLETYFNYRSVTLVNYPSFHSYDPRFSNLKLATNLVYMANPIYENKFDNSGFWTNPFFSDKVFDGRQITVDVTHQGNDIGDSLVYINLVSMSQGYYERKKSEDLFNANLNNVYASPTALFSNFSNAYGFLAGRSVSRDSIKIILYKKYPYSSM